MALSIKALLPLALYLAAQAEARPLKRSDATLPDGWVTVGCLTNMDGTAPILSQHSMTNVAMNTPLRCAAVCITGGYSYAGTGQGSECYCGNELVGPVDAPDARCDISCPGDNQQTCGGDKYLNVYQKATATSTVTPSSTSTVSATSTPTASGIVHKGCYTDTDSVRTLYWSAGNAPIHTLGWTPSYCQEKCASKNFQYSGVEDGGACYCSNYISNILGAGQQVDQSECSTPCRTLKTETCGGTDRIDIWYNPSVNTALYSGFTRSGCYSDSTDKPLLDHKLENDTPKNGWEFQDCAGQCALSDYAYAGLENGTDCWCGRDLQYLDANNNNRKVDDSQCNIPCPGNSTQTCGGSTTMDVFFNQALYETTHW